MQKEKKNVTSLMAIVIPSSIIFLPVRIKPNREQREPMSSPPSEAQ